MPLQTESSFHGGNSQPSTPSELDLKKRKSLDKAKAVHLSRQLQLRLQYARLKVDHGWQKQNLNEVENLYFRHSHLNLHIRPARPRPLTTSTTTIGSDISPVSFRFKAGGAEGLGERVIPIQVDEDASMDEGSEVVISPQPLPSMAADAHPFLPSDSACQSDEVIPFLNYPAVTEPLSSPSPSPSKKRKRMPIQRAPDSPSPPSSNGTYMHSSLTNTNAILVSPNPSTSSALPSGTIGPSEPDGVDVGLMDPTFNTFTSGGKSKKARAGAAPIEILQQGKTIPLYPPSPSKSSGTIASPSPFANSTMTYDSFWSNHASGRTLVTSLSPNGTGVVGASRGGSAGNAGIVESN